MKYNTEQIREEIRKYFDGNEEIKRKMEDNYIYHSKKSMQFTTWCHLMKKKLEKNIEIQWQE